MQRSRQTIEETSEDAGKKGKDASSDAANTVKGAGAKAKGKASEAVKTIHANGQSAVSGEVC